MGTILSAGEGLTINHFINQDLLSISPNFHYIPNTLWSQSGHYTGVLLYVDNTLWDSTVASGKTDGWYLAKETQQSLKYTWSSIAVTRLAHAHAMLDSTHLASWAGGGGGGGDTSN